MINTINNVNGQWRTLQGPRAIEALRLRSLKTFLLLWSRTGLQPTRGVKILTLAQQATGLRTRNIATLTAALDALLERELDQCEIGTLTTPPTGDDGAA